MSTFLSITNVLAFRHRVASVLEALKERGITADAVRAEFLAAGENKIATQDAWGRLDRLENPTAAELRLFARVLQVNTTWLITGDVRFVPELLATTCLCWPVPEHMWTTYGSAVDPATTHEHNPDCPVHGPEVESDRFQRPVLMNVVRSAAQEDVPLGWIVPRTVADWGLTPDTVSNPTHSEMEF